MQADRTSSDLDPPFRFSGVSVPQEVDDMLWSSLTNTSNLVTAALLSTRHGDSARRRLRQFKSILVDVSNVNRWLGRTDHLKELQDLSVWCEPSDTRMDPQNHPATSASDTETQLRSALVVAAVPIELEGVQMISMRIINHLLGPPSAAKLHRLAFGVPQLFRPLQLKAAWLAALTQEIR